MEKSSEESNEMNQIFKKNEDEHNVPLHQNQNCETLCHLFQLPLEVLGDFLEKPYISHEDKLCLRTVHPIFRFLFDEYIGFKVTLRNEDSPSKMDFISNLAIRKALIQNLTVTSKIEKKQDFVVKTQPPKFHRIFCYPEYLQELTIKGEIDAELFNEIVRKCEGLRVLEVHAGSLIKVSKEEGSCRHVLPEIDITSPQHSLKKYLPNCTSLKLLLNQQQMDEQGSGSNENNATPPDLNCEAVLAVIKSVKSFNLTRAVLQGWISQRFSVSRITLIASEFLERNPTIQSFFLGIIYDHLIDDEEPVNAEDSKLRPLIEEKLKNAGNSLKIRKLGISTKSTDFFLWKDFMKRQTYLVHISLTVDLVDGILSQEVIKPSRNTLKQFILRGKFKTSFDFSWIEECQNLKEICLHNIENQPDAEMQGSTLHVMNIASVPKQLESLVLFQTVGRTDDVLAALRKLEGLRTLALFKTGNNAEETGTNVEVIKAVFSIRTLESLLLVRFVATNPVEASELLKIVQLMNTNREDADIDQNDLIEVGELNAEIRLDNEEEPRPMPGLVEADPRISPNNDNLPVVLQDITTESVGEPGGPGPVVVPSSSSSTHKEDTPDKPVCQKDKPSEEPSKSHSQFEICHVEEDNLNADVNMLNNNNNSDSDKPKAKPRTNNNVGLEEPNLLTHEITSTSGNNADHHESQPTPLPLIPATEAVPEIDTASHQEDDTVNNNPPDPDLTSTSITNTAENDQMQAALEEVTTEEGNPGADEDPEWEDIDSDDETISSDLEDLEFDEFDNLPEDGEEGAGDEDQFHVVVNLQNEDDLQEMLGLLDPQADNVQLGFILDGVIDIQSVGEGKRSRWVAVEDENGHLTYTLKITID